MSTTKKVSIVTGTRADYGIYVPVLEELHNHPHFEINLIVTGMHLSPAHGLTVNEILKDGFTIGAKVDMLLQGSTGATMAKGVGLAIIGMTQALEELSPDCILVLGDRGEMLAAAIAASHLNIPVAHLHGGEVSGSIDESVRHAISKLAHIHFTSTVQSSDRLIRMGEDSWRVHTVGAPRIDTILNTNLPPILEVKKKYNLLEIDKYFLLVFHPVSTEVHSINDQVENVVKATVEEGIPIVTILPNSDAGNQSILDVFQQYHDHPLLRFVKNFNHLDYLTVLKHCYAMVGNSSSGIIEAASFGVPVINIGTRQDGRERSGNTIDSTTSLEDIKNALALLKKGEFLDDLANVTNVYGDGHSSRKIVEILSEVDMTEEALIKKIIAY